jgi:hypothetical protein
MFKGSLSKAARYEIEVSAAPTNGRSTIVTVQWPGARNASDVMLIATGGSASLEGKVPRGAKALLVDVDGPSATSRATVRVGERGKPAVRGTVRGDGKWTFAIV